MEKDKTKNIIEVVAAEELVPMGRILREMMDISRELRFQKNTLEKIWSKVKGLPQ